MPIHKPSRDDLAAAANRTIPDLVGPDLRVLFSGINPSLYSAATGHHFARPGNRFWPALHRSGFTDRLLHPSEQFVAAGRRPGHHERGRPRDGPRRRALPRRVGRRAAPGWRRWWIAGSRAYLAVLGVTAYRTAFARPKAIMGPQDHKIAGVRVWVLPNPSGLNAHYTVDGLATAFAALREATPADPRIDPAVGVQVLRVSVVEVVDRQGLGVLERIVRRHQEVRLAHREQFVPDPVRFAEELRRHRIDGQGEVQLAALGRHLVAGAGPPVNAFVPGQVEAGESGPVPAGPGS